MTASTRAEFRGGYQSGIDKPDLRLLLVAAATQRIKKRTRAYHEFCNTFVRLSYSSGILVHASKRATVGEITWHS